MPVTIHSDDQLRARQIASRSLDIIEWNIAKAIAEERERCAQIAEGWASGDGQTRDLEISQEIAALIREPQ